MPEDGKLQVELYGQLAALINLAKQTPRSKGTGVKVTMVAGAHYRLDLQLRELLRTAIVWKDLRTSVLGP